jgi:ribosomal protein L22
MNAVETQTVRAQAKWVRTSARKARLVAEHIRGRSVPEARTVLAFTQRAAAREVEKVLKSAVANAESRPDLHWHGDELVVASVTVDEGPTLKRWRARARGRVARIKKRTCHITVTLAAGDGALAAPPKRAQRRKAELATPAAEEKPKRARAAKPKPAADASETTRPRAKRGAEKKEA